MLTEFYKLLYTQVERFILYSYLSCCTLSQEHMDLWQKAFPGEGEVDPEDKKAVTQTCEFLSNMCKMIEWLICDKHIKCTKPNERRNPDVVVWIPPTDETTFPIPLLIVKIVGGKNVWGSGEAQYKG